MLSMIFNESLIESIGYPSIEDESFDRFLDFDDAWLWKYLKSLAEDPDFEKKYLASDLIQRDPIRCVIEAYTMIERDSGKVEPHFQTIKDLQEDIEGISAKSGISPENIFFDEPWSDLPIESTYRPYIRFHDYSLGEEAPFEEKSPILIRLRRGIDDIANIPSTLAFKIAQQDAQVIRLYTLSNARKELCEALAEIRPSLRPLIWFDKC